MPEGAGMQILKYSLSVLITLLLVGNAGAQKLSDPPMGYSWVACKEIRASFLLPWGWYFKKGVQGDTFGYYFTQQNIEEKGEFLSGLSVNVIPNIPQKNGMSPSVYADSFIKAAILQKEIFKLPWQEGIGSLQGYGVVLLNHDPQRGDFISYNLAIANDRTGTLYLLTFESPAETWEQYRVVAGVMLKQFLLDDSF